ncbi:glycosyltransferase family 2 protein [Zunongwangia sp.]|uniref:glycosyltransferase family 2 protein n=1 Tax=Zunongwangia sp. TaxID=1965325 RepID=UPI003AA91F44
MKTAVVILNWNGQKLLELFLPSVIQFSPEATIYVADNASTDTSIKFLKENYPQIQLILNTENGGYAKGYNEALKHLTEDIFILLNSDVEVTKNWLTPILSIFKEDANTAAVQPKLLDYNNRNYFEYAGAAGGFIDKYGYPFCRGRIFDTLEEDINQYNDVSEIFWASGACLAIRNKAFKEAGGFDNDFFAHQEEIDLCWRLKNNGYSIKYTSRSSVYHLGGATLNKMSPKKTYLNFRNSLFMLTKNLPKNKLWSILFFRMVWDGIAAMKFAIGGEFQHFLAVAKAHSSFYKNFLKMHKKRSSNKKITNYYNINSIIITYFIKNKKTFKKLI